MILVICNDTHGGVLPYARLAGALHAAGLPVAAVAPEEAVDLFTQRGVTVTPLPGTAQVAELLATGVAERGTLATLRLMREKLPAALSGWLRATDQAAVGARLFVGGIGGSGLARAVGQARGIPFLPAHLHPIGAPSGAYPSPMLGRLPTWLGPGARWISHTVGAALLDAPSRGAMRRARREVLDQSGPLSPEGPAIYALTQALVPVPPAPGRVVTGIWRDPVDAGLPPAVLAFLAADNRPVISAGFGSMGSADAGALSDLVVQAARQAGARVILLGGWAGLSATGEDVLTLPSVPHGALFPQVAAIVHHGGAGTTGAAALAGRPQVIVPFAVDQPFWAARVAAADAGPPGIPRKALTTARLAAALRAALTDPRLLGGATALGRAARAEPGLPLAVQTITRAYRG